MLYLSSDASHPIEFVSCGNLISEDGFLHPKRNLDSFVFILVIEGTLHIKQGERDFDVGSNDFVLLLPDTLHMGTTPSKGLLSYLWVHFYVTDPSYTIYSKRSLSRNPFIVDSQSFDSLSPQNILLLPEAGTLSIERRSLLLFRQLLDLSKREHYKPTWPCHYAVSSLLLEVSADFFKTNHLVHNNIPIKVLDIMEWIRTHYNQPLTVDMIAKRFGYHPTYLSNLFKKHTGHSLISYINVTRVNVAKNLLGNRTQSIYSIALLSGFTDEKYFMKLFKKYEDITPTQYRKAFHQRKVNIE